MKQYCLYLRKSRADIEAEAHGEGETLARHERILLEFARKQNYNITEIYKEIVSGETIASRPVVQTLLSEVEQGIWSGVLVVEVERLARGDTIDQGIIAQAFKYSDTKIITPTKVYDPSNEFDEEYFEFGLFMSRREYKTINRRLQQGRIAASKEGKYVGSKDPYGYNRKKIEGGKGWTLTVNEQEAEIVRYIFNVYTNGEIDEDGSVRHIGSAIIASRLTALNIPTPQGKVNWSSAAVRVILSNPVYIGKIRWRHYLQKKTVQDGKVVKKRVRAVEDEEVLVDGLHVPIIDEETFFTAQTIIKNRPLPMKKSAKLQNPLSGILVCKRCGKSMHLHTSHYKDEITSTVRCGNRKCRCPSSRILLVEKRIIEGLKEWIADYEIRFDVQDSSEQKKQAESMLKTARANVENIRSMITKTHELLEKGVYDIDTFLDRTRALSEKLKEAEVILDNAKVDYTREMERLENSRNIIPKAKKLIEVYYSLPSAQAKNKMLKEVLEKVEYDREKRMTKGGRLDDFEITIFPKLPRNKR